MHIEALQEIASEFCCLNPADTPAATDGLSELEAD
jgi:hypothetical protein